MEIRGKRPLLEVLSWIAGIIGTSIDAYAMLSAPSPSQEQTPPASTAPASRSIASTTQAPVAAGGITVQPKRELEPPAIHFQNERYAKTMSSRHEELIVSSGLGTGGKTQAIPNGTDLPDAGALGHIVHVYAAIVWPNRTVLVVGGSNGGSCCPWEVYSLLMVDAAGKYRIVRNEHFLGNLSVESMSVRGNEVAFDLGFQNKKRVIALFDGDTLRLEETYLAAIRGQTTISLNLRATTAPTMLHPRSFVSALVLACTRCFSLFPVAIVDRSGSRTARPLSFSNDRS